jgi:hypothetical protein
VSSLTCKYFLVTNEESWSVTFQTLPSLTQAKFWRKVKLYLSCVNVEE